MYAPALILRPMPLVWLRWRHTCQELLRSVRYSYHTRGLLAVPKLRGVRLSLACSMRDSFSVVVVHGAPRAGIDIFLHLVE